MSRNQLQPQRSNSNRRGRTESENSGKWENDDGLQMKSERQPLSPVSEAPDELMDDDDEGMMMYDIMEGGVPAPPDGGWGWVVVFASFMCNLIVDGIAYTFGVFLPKFAEDFKEGKGSVAWAGSLLCGVYLCVGPIVSALTNKYGCRAVCIAGSIVGSAGFALSTLSNSLNVLMITYGIIGGVGFGLVYLPAVVCVGYYFESKRAMATGIAVCGSGVGTFVFAPFASWMLEFFGDWRQANWVFAGLILSCGLFGILMRPLEVQIEVEEEEEEDDEYAEEDAERGSGRRNKPLLLRMAEEKRNYMEKGSLAGSAYFMVQLPDGTMERRMKLPLNVDPGVHSSFNLDQLVPGTPLTPVPTMATLPTITEAKATDNASVTGSDGSREGSLSISRENSTKDVKSPVAEKKVKGVESVEENNNPVPNIPEPIIEEEKESDDGPDIVEESQLSTSATSAQRRSLRERRNSEGVSSSSVTPSSSFKQTDGVISRSPTKPIPMRSGSIAAPQLGSRSVGVHGSMPRNGSAPQFNTGRSIPKNTSVPLFDKQARKHSYRAVPLGMGTSIIRNSSKPNLQDARRGSFKNSIASFVSSKNNNIGNQEDDTSSYWSKAELSEGLIFSSSQKNQQEPRHIIRPLSRKDIFYSGSIVQLPEFQSQKSLTSYRQSILNLPKAAGLPDIPDSDSYSPQKQKPRVCPCIPAGPGACTSAISQMMDFSLLKNPVFLFIAISNVFGMLGFYIPFVYLIDAAVTQGIEKEKAAFLISIIGITNTIGRVGSGVLSDLPQVNSLFMNNMCILLSGLSVAVVPLCANYYAFVGVALFFGLFVSGYVSLTSIILVDLLGLDNLTNAFGLLILFRGLAGIVGAPLAGAIFDAFQSYDVPFFLAGGFLILSAAISFLVPCVSKYAPPKPVLEPRTPIGGYLEDIPEGAESISNNSEEYEKCDQVESCV